MTTISHALFSELVAEANLSPSVHNTQPTRWRLEQDGGVRVLEDASRRLPIGDPRRQDAGVSHGAAIEGFALAASARGWKVDVTAAEGDAPDGLSEVARLDLRKSASSDPLHPHLLTRRTYRGRFAGGAPASDLASLEAQDDVRVLTDPADLSFIAGLNDAAGLQAFRNKPYRAELVSWMRFSRRNPNWSLDGLNAEAMAMSPVEAAGAAMVLKPGVFETLDRFGLASPLVAESAVVASALGVVLFHRPAAEPPLTTGRRFHRVWLELEARGLSAAPMAVLADDANARGELCSRFGIPPDRRLVTAWRFGRASNPPLSRKARLPVSALIV